MVPSIEIKLTSSLFLAGLLYIRKPDVEVKGLGFPFSHPNFFPMGMGKIGNWEIFPWEFLGIFQNRKNAKKRTFLIALLFLLFFFQSLFPFKVTS